MANVVNNSNVEFVYLKIPVEYINVYRKLITCIGNLKDVIKDISIEFDKNKTIKKIYDCWFMFQAAVASNKLGDVSKADSIINYIDTYLNEVYFKDTNSTGCECEVLEIDENGLLKVRTNHDDCMIPTFYVDPLTGDLMSQYED